MRGQKNKEMVIQESVTNNTIENLEDPTIHITNINWELLKKIKKYDILLVKMRPEDISKGIEKEHQIRPFLVNKIHTKTPDMDGYYLTGNIFNLYFMRPNRKGLKLVLSQNNYNLNKSSLVLFHQSISLPYASIIDILDHLQPKDLQKLKKYRNLLYKQPTISNKQNRVIEIGDIVLFENKEYIIYQMDNTQCYGYCICKSEEAVDLEKNYNYISFENQLYFIDYSSNKIFHVDEELKIVDRFNDQTIKWIKQNKKELKFNQKCKKRKSNVKTLNKNYVLNKNY